MSDQELDPNVGVDINATEPLPEPAPNTPEEDDVSDEEV